MRFGAKYFLGTFFLFFPVLTSAQHLGQVTCARRGDYTYLYSSITTMEVLRTLQCGEQVEVAGRYQGFFSVRTAKRGGRIHRGREPCPAQRQARR